MKALINISLLLFSIVANMTIGAFGVFYGLLKNLIGFPTKAIDVAYTLDINGNILCGELFNDTLLIKPSKYIFGKKEETISLVLKRNYDINNLSKTGKKLYNLIEWIDKGHFDATNFD